MVSRDEKRASASLRISSRVRSASEITGLMGIPPSRVYEKGDLVSVKSPQPTYRQDTMWILASGLRESDSLDDHVASICRLIKEHRSEFDQLRSDCDVDVFCGFFSDSGQAGFGLSSETLEEIGKLQVDLIFDVYPGG